MRALPTTKRVLVLPGLEWVITRNDTSQLESTMSPLRVPFFTLLELQPYPSNSIKSQKNLSIFFS